MSFEKSRHAKAGGSIRQRSGATWALRSTSLAALVIAGCHCHAPPTPPPPPVCTPPTIAIDPSLVVHDPALLAARFGLSRTLQAIIDTSGGAATSPANLLSSMLQTFDDPSMVNGGHTLPLDVRPAEAGLPAADLLDPASARGMVPVGLFNRFDLAPADGNNCGEYRIVYAKNQASPGRLLLIFESRLRNPDPASGLEGCLPVAQFWTDLAGEPDPTARITKLESFYYTGLPGFDAVVRHRNYGAPLGQVRSNLFVTPLWELREHRAGFDLASRAVFLPGTVGESPVAELYRPGLAPGFSAPDSVAFRDHFGSQPLCNLLRPDRVDSSATRFDIVNGIGAGFDRDWLDGQSVSQNPSDDPASGPDASFVTQIAGRLGTLGVTSVGATEALHRAGAMSCGGCHQFSNGRPLSIGGANPWPSSRGFVHIDEGGGLSEALDDFFLPRRAQILSRFMCSHLPEPSPSAPCPGVTATTAAAGSARARPTDYLAPADAARDALIQAARRAQSAHEAIRSAAVASEVAAAVRRFNEEVDRARAHERALPGAFVPVRRVH